MHCEYKYYNQTHELNGGIVRTVCVLVSITEQPVAPKVPPDIKTGNSLNFSSVLVQIKHYGTVRKWSVHISNICPANLRVFIDKLAFLPGDNKIAENKFALV